MKTKKVLDICLDGLHLVCIRYQNNMNPFRVYRVCNGHRLQIAKYGDFLSVICFIRELYVDGADTFDTAMLKKWAMDRRI